MSDRERPWSKFYWQDYEGDVALRQCSLAAQGLWMRMLCICAKGNPVGYLAINGKSLDLEALSRIVGQPAGEVATLVEELSTWGVLSRDRIGRIYSRRIVKDAKIARKSRENGMKGGNPSLRKTTDNPPPDNPPVNGGDKTQKPEARSQRPEVREEREDPALQQRLSTSPREAAAAAASVPAADPVPIEDSDLADELTDAIGAKAPAWAWAGMHVHRWRQTGATPDQLRAVFATYAARGRAPPTTPGYFDGAIADAIAAAQRPMPRGDPTATATPIRPDFTAAIRRGLANAK